MMRYERIADSNRVSRLRSSDPMDGPVIRRIWSVIALAIILPACSDGIPVEELPESAETIRRIGRRLSQSLAVQELSDLAERGDRLLAKLTATERTALAQGALRFRVDQPVRVDVATPGRSVPFWINDLGFNRLSKPLGVAGSDWAVFRKRYPAGWVGLGVNGLDRSPKAHYVVFVRPAEAKTDADRPIVGHAPEGWRITTAHEGTSAASDLDLPIDSLPDDLKGALLLQPAHDRRHAALLAPGRVWKTHVASTPTPDQVSVAFGTDPARSLVWTWRTMPSIERSALRLAPVTPGWDGRAPCGPIRTIVGESQSVDSPGLLNDPVIRRHRATATDLTPGTSYAYSLGDGSPDHWTPWKKVRTGPATPRSFGFLYLGDPQCGLEEWGKLLAGAYRDHPDTAFLLIAGDLVDRGNERTNWDHFFLRASGVLEELPLLPCAGNHEYLDQGPRLYRGFFTLPHNGPEGIDRGLVYSFEYCGAFVAILDSTPATVDPATARKQAEWLDAALNRTTAAWKFVMFHHPVYASHPRRESPALRESWTPVFDRHHVDLVLQGHDHAYLRTHPLRADRRIESAEQGTVYVVSVSGTKFYDQRQRPETAVGFTSLATYQTIDIQQPQNRLVYRAWDRDGREVDHFTIDKPSDAPRCATTILP
jgi:hypothetical protein